MHALIYFLTSSPLESGGSCSGEQRACHRPVNDPRRDYSLSEPYIHAPLTSYNYLSFTIYKGYGYGGDPNAFIPA